MLQGAAELGAPPGTGLLRGGPVSMQGCGQAVAATADVGTGRE